MKPIIILIRRALAKPDSSESYAKPALFTVDGIEFKSELPGSSREAIEINTAIERLQDLAK